MKRFLLLGVALASLGAILATSALSNPTGSAVTGGSSTVSVQPLVNLTAAFANPISPIPANGSPHKVADIVAGENDPDYDIAATSLAITTQGTTTGTCTSLSATPFTQTSSGLGVDLAPDGVANVDIGDLFLTIPVTVNSDCTVSGAVVTVTFQAI